mgnify:CR=1 FL=1
MELVSRGMYEDEQNHMSHVTYYIHRYLLSELYKYICTIYIYIYIYIHIYI